ncbi:MAG: LacI family DNA-binding transcriptional regulator [Anaerolineae bacterium]
MRRHVTQSDVARRAGVSRVTVSNVLNGRPQKHIRIPEETCKRILAAAEELGYQPNAAARSLRSGRAGIIGLLLPDVRNPHYWAMARGVERAAMEHGYHVILTVSALGPESERQCLLALAQQRVDGLIVALHYRQLTETWLDKLRQCDAPVVPNAKDNVWVRYDLGMEQVMHHLLQLGHRHIAYIHGVPSPGMGQERLDGYRKGLSDAGIALREEMIVHCGGTLEDGHAAARQLLSLSPRPTAIIGLNDLMAIGAMKAAGELGLSIPRDLSVVGFDDADISAHLYPPLTTVRGHSEESGWYIATLLFQRIENPDLPPRSVEIPVELMVRGTTGPCPGVASGS